MEPVRRRELIERYREGHGAVVRALDGVDLDARPGPDDWSPREIVHHLSDATQVAAVRLRRLLAEERPAISGYDEERYARLLHYERPIEASLASFAAAVVSSVELLEALDDAEWAREGEHEEFGAYSVDVWLERQAEHVHEHAEQILRCRR